MGVLKIAIYGGSFDPIHHGHLILAHDAIEQLELEKVILVPVAVSPFKKPPIASGEMRLSMLRGAIKGEMGFAVDDCELRRSPPSYTIDTVVDIRRREPGAEIFCLIGDDNVRDLAKWHRFAELEKEGFGKFPICVAKTQYSFTTNPDAKGAPSGFTTVTAPCFCS